MSKMNDYSATPVVELAGKGDPCSLTKFFMSILLVLSLPLMALAWVVGVVCWLLTQFWLDGWRNADS